MGIRGFRIRVGSWKNRFLGEDAGAGGTTAGAAPASAMCEGGSKSWSCCLGLTSFSSCSLGRETNSGKHASCRGMESSNRRRAPLHFIDAKGLFQIDAKGLFRVSSRRSRMLYPRLFLSFWRGRLTIRFVTAVDLPRCRAELSQIININTRKLKSCSSIWEPLKDAVSRHPERPTQP
jgi:hypothetical protein